MDDHGLLLFGALIFVLGASGVAIAIATGKAPIPPIPLELPIRLEPGWPLDKDRHPGLYLLSVVIWMAVTMLGFTLMVLDIPSFFTP
jgi:hypothetical protein